jgi:hypothetical protein
LGGYLLLGGKIKMSEVRVKVNDLCAECAKSVVKDYKLYCRADNCKRQKEFKLTPIVTIPSENDGAELPIKDVEKIDLVSHPAHYNKEGHSECWDEMKNLFGTKAVIIFDLLSAYKYYYRAGLKDGNSSEQENAKIEVYMNHAKDLIMKMVANGDRYMMEYAEHYSKMQKLLNERGEGD